MKLIVIGTSCSWFERKNTSFLIDDEIVFDVPSGAYKDIIKFVDPQKIDSVIISHLHSDHFGDFHLLATRFMRHFKVGDKKLKVYCPKDLPVSLIECNKYTYGASDEQNIEAYKKAIDFIKLEDNLEFEIKDYKVKAFKVEHGIPETFGFVFQDKNHVSVGFSADTSYCNNLEEIVKSSKFAFVEMSSVVPHPTHLNIDEFESLAKKFQNTKLFPVHTSDKTQAYAESHGLNFLHDGQVLNLY